MKILTRSRTNRIVAGVCGGLGEYLEIDPNIIRVAWVVATVLLGFFPGIFVYGLIWLLVPDEAPPVTEAGPEVDAPFVD